MVVSFRLCIMVICHSPHGLLVLARHAPAHVWIVCVRDALAAVYTPRAYRTMLLARVVGHGAALIAILVAPAPILCQAAADA
jgi:hypothetical protein